MSTPILRLWAPVALYMAVLFALSSQSVLPGASLTPDWMQHGVAYAGLAVVTLRATAGGQWSGIHSRALLAAWIVATLYGVSDEFHQSFVPTRSADPRDVSADAIGAALGLLAAWAWGIIRRSS
ncbi:MAG TPA: VanZ family protein [Vicinamibacterales bacterium]|nr:VanZ family protein [Vicinamibacterales bacterium]